MSGRLGHLALVAAIAVMSSNAMAQTPTLRVGLTSAPPFGGPEPGGYCFDLMNAIGARTGMSFEFVPPMAAGELIGALAGGTFDILCSANGPTNERRAMGLAFTSAIATNGEMVVVLATDTAAYTTLAELQGIPVGAPAGTLFVAMLRDAGITDVREYAGPALYQALIAGEVRAILTSAPTFAYQHNVRDQWPELRVVETYPIQNPIYSSLAVRSTETELLGTLQAALEGLKADGTLVTLAETWAVPLPPF